MHDKVNQQSDIEKDRCGDGNSCAVTPKAWRIDPWKKVLLFVLAFVIAGDYWWVVWVLIAGYVGMMIWLSKFLATPTAIERRLTSSKFGMSVQQYAIAVKQDAIEVQQLAIELVKGFGKVGNDFGKFGMELVAYIIIPILGLMVTFYFLSSIPIWAAVIIVLLILILIKQH